ncbi:MAG TPA: DUF179 domain-containing protein [Aliiroseovarius sp.]|nr:DUF179 domain-containing protein [Aliiroseovarius sp.]
MNTTKTNLTGKLLIAMPGMLDPRFDHSVVFLCAHSHEGTMGLVVNKPASDINLGDLLQQLDIPGGADSSGQPIFYGGPVEIGRGFVLHSSEYGIESGTLEVNDSFAMTATKEVLEDIAAGHGPRVALPALGYAGWGPGQLEGEIRENAWLTAEADYGIVFETAIADKWAAALGKLGISPLTLSAEGGRA